MTSPSNTYPQAPDVSTTDYVPVGLAVCFFKEDGEVHQVNVLEPIPTSGLSTLLAGVPTSYQKVYGLNLGDVLDGEAAQRWAGCPEGVGFCEDFAFRAVSAARTFQRQPELAKLVPVGAICDSLNHSTERKRVLNLKNVVSAEDNVKQHAHTHKVL